MAGNNEGDFPTGRACVLPPSSRWLLGDPARGHTSEIRTNRVAIHERRKRRLYTKLDNASIAGFHFRIMNGQCHRPHTIPVTVMAFTTGRTRGVDRVVGEK